MSTFVGRWTDSDNIKAHLQSSEIETPVIYDEPILLDSLTPGQLLHNNITDGSEVVKLRGTDILTYTTKVLVGTVAQLLAQYIVPGFKGSVFAASDAILTISYVEGKDFVVDYTTGMIKRASVGSAIASGSTVHIWYIPYTVMTKNIDYAIDYDAGTIERIAGTSIPDGSTVNVDYSHTQSTVTDDLIKRAIIESEEFMADRMSSVSITDEGLTTAANYYAMAIIALSQAAKELKSRSNNSDTLAKIWNTLHDTYNNRAQVAFKRFASTTDLNPGGVMQNRFSQDRSISRTSPSVTPGYRAR